MLWQPLIKGKSQKKKNFCGVGLWEMRFSTVLDLLWCIVNIKFDWVTFCPHFITVIQKT